MENISKTTYQDYSISDVDNLLFILYNELIFIYDGEKWGIIYINQINMPDTDFKNLKRPGLVEVSPNLIGKDFIKSFIVTGGFNPFSKSCVKTVYLLNFKKNKQFDDSSKKEIITYDCLLDFKYADMKTSRFLHSSINIDNKYILLIGGKNEKEWLNSCEYLNLKTGKWENFPSLKCARTNFDACCYLDYKTDRKTIFVYGGFSGPNKFAEILIEYCNIEEAKGELVKTEWKSLKYFNDNNLNLAKISARIIKYEENILIIGGSDGKHILKDVNELDPQNGVISHIGELNTAKNNFHVLLRDEYFYVVGGSANKFIREDDVIINYAEKFTFNLSNRIECDNVSAINEFFLYPIRNLSINETEFSMEPGFPYSASIMTKKFA